MFNDLVIYPIVQFLQYDNCTERIWLRTWYELLRSPSIEVISANVYFKNKKKLSSNISVLDNCIDRDRNSQTCGKFWAFYPVYVYDHLV